MILDLAMAESEAPRSQGACRESHTVLPHVAMELTGQSGFSDELPSRSESFRCLGIVTSSQRSVTTIPDMEERSSGKQN